MRPETMEWFEASGRMRGQLGGAPGDEKPLGGPLVGTGWAEPIGEAMPRT